MLADRFMPDTLADAALPPERNRLEVEFSGNFIWLTPVRS
jgi:hypothetical protein